MNTEIINSIISGLSTILATTIPSLVGLYSANKLINVIKYKKKLITAYKDLQYMNELERQFIENNKEQINQSLKNQIHNRTREKLGFYKSDKGHDSYIKRYLEKVNEMEGDDSAIN